MLIRNVGIVGTGPSALMAATVLSQNGVKVVLFDQKKAPARKFLVAGHGGFNLTNNEDIEAFILKYDQKIIKDAVELFNKDDFRDFLLSIGIETFVGSSGKIFPIKGIKPIEVLQNWLSLLKKLEVEIKLNHTLIDFGKNNLVFESKNETINFSCDAIIFALGGGSWEKTGSNSKWLSLFEKKGIKCKTFSSGNSGFVLKNHVALWEFKGTFIKNCNVFSSTNEKKGDLVITDYGIEGAPVYALNRSFREGEKIFIDFKPDLNIESILTKLRESKNPSEGLKALKLSKGAVQYIKSLLSKEEFQNLNVLALKIKKLEIEIDSLRPIDEVISTVGGVEMDQIDTCFRLKNIPSIYCIGEMLDWDAPTGGYLIQACVSSGFVAGRTILNQS